MGKPIHLCGCADQPPYLPGMACKGCSDNCLLDCLLLRHLFRPSELFGTSPATLREFLLLDEHIIRSQGIRCCGWQQQCTAGVLKAAGLQHPSRVAQGLIIPLVVRQISICAGDSAVRMHAMAVHSRWTATVIVTVRSAFNPARPCMCRHQRCVHGCWESPCGCHA